MKLDHGQLHLLRLAAKDADDTGWANVSSVVWPLASALPDDLVLKVEAEDGGGKIYLTDAGKALVKYT